MAVLKFVNVPEKVDCSVETSVRVRPFFEREELVEERKHPSYTAKDNLICVQGKQTKFEIIKFKKIFSEKAKQEEVFESIISKIESAIEGFNNVIIALG